MRLLTDGHPDDPVLDMALSHALLRQVASGAAEPAARVFRPGPTMAFGRLDALRPGFGGAAAAAAAHGFTPVLRLGGGHAAAYDAGAVVVDVVTREANITEGLQERFAAGTDVLVDALRRVGADPVVGELAGEYCPGRWSIHAAGGPKLAGAAQRSIRGASLFTAVVVVEGGDRLRAALVDVYAALGLDWDPATAGAVEDGVPGLPADAVARAVEAALADRYGPLDPVGIDPGTRASAVQLQASHRRH
jgi:lipoate-protein ligase A